MSDLSNERTKCFVPILMSPSDIEVTVTLDFIKTNFSFDIPSFHSLYFNDASTLKVSVIMSQYKDNTYKKLVKQINRQPIIDTRVTMRNSLLIFAYFKPLSHVT